MQRTWIWMPLADARLDRLRRPRGITTRV